MNQGANDEPISIECECIGIGSWTGRLRRDRLRNQNYVRTQTTPLVEHTDQLDSKTAANNQQLHAVDDRAQAGIKQAQGAADSANQNAQSATKAAAMLKQPRLMWSIAPIR